MDNRASLCREGARPASETVERDLVELEQARVADLEPLAGDDGTSAVARYRLERFGLREPERPLPRSGDDRLGQRVLALALCTCDEASWTSAANPWCPATSPNTR